MIYLLGSTIAFSQYSPPSTIGPPRPLIGPTTISARPWQPPPQLLKKNYALWMELTLPVCVEFAGALRRHPACLAPSAPARSSARRQAKKRGRQPASMHPGDRASKAHKGPDPLGSRGKAPIPQSDDEDAHPSDTPSPESASSLTDCSDREYSSSDVDDPDGALPPTSGAPSKLQPPGFSIAESGFLSNDHFDICRQRERSSLLVHQTCVAPTIGTDRQ